MFYANGRIYYTRSGQNSLYWRWFSPDSGIIGGIENTVAGGNITWSSTKGMFLDGSNLYVVNSTNGQLLKIGFVNGAPTGTSTVANTTHRLARPGGVPRLGAAERRADRRLHVGLHGHLLHLRRRPARPTATARSSPTSGRSATATRPAARTRRRTSLATGTYDVTLTVTDDGGLSSLGDPPGVGREAERAADRGLHARRATYLDCDFDATDVDRQRRHRRRATRGTSVTARPAPAPRRTTSTRTPAPTTITLVVTDDERRDRRRRPSTQVVVGAPAPSTVSYVGGAVNQGNVATPNVTTPTTVSAGDRLVMVLTVNASNRVLSDPTGVTGWTVLDTTTSGSMQTRVYTKIADRGRREQEGHRDPGRGGQVHDDRGRLLRRARRGARPRRLRRDGDPGGPRDADGRRAGRLVGRVLLGRQVRGDDRLRPARLGDRPAAPCAAPAPATSAARWPTPTARCRRASTRGLVATADTANGNATTWSIILRTIEPNQAPTASFTFTCDERGLRLRRHRLERPRRLRGLLRVGLRRRRHGDRRDRRATTS